jgi:hypothetical protein
MINTKNKNGLCKLNCNQCHKICTGQAGRKFRDKYKQHFRYVTQSKENQKHARRLAHATRIRKNGTEHRYFDEYAQKTRIGEQGTTLHIQI